MDGIAQTTAERKTHVADALGAVEGEGQLLLDSLQRLEQRLGDVLRVEEPATANKIASDPRAPLVPLADHLTAHSNTLRIARHYVTSMLERLEL